MLVFLLQQKEMKQESEPRLNAQLNLAQLPSRAARTDFMAPQTATAEADA